VPKLVHYTTENPPCHGSQTLMAAQVRYGASSEACSYVPPILAILVVLVTK